MTKHRKGNKEFKKPKAVAGEAKKQKKDPKSHDGPVSGLLGDSK